MGLFSCKHKKLKVILCERKSTTYSLECLKCKEIVVLPKGPGEEYMVGQIIGGPNASMFVQD